jgi:16S rRNA (cytosine967-C5)-methyltransferase
MRAKENLARLGQSDVTQCLDLTQPQPGLGSFDQILLDAPCSASGVIRRHPDIKLLRRESDLQTLRATQDRLLQACWQLLRPGGHLLYVTCSIFLEENTDAIAEFLRDQSEAVLKPLPTIGVPCTFGVQLLPTVGAHDGFYFARIKKMGHGI